MKMRFAMLLLQMLQIIKLKYSAQLTSKMPFHFQLRPCDNWAGWVLAASSKCLCGSPLCFCTACTASLLSSTVLVSPSEMPNALTLLNIPCSEAGCHTGGCWFETAAAVRSAGNSTCLSRCILDEGFNILMGF